MKAVRLVTENDEEHRDFAAISAAGLGRAYSTDEPKYFTSDIKEKNPDFRD